MRKKAHRRINANNREYDRFYVINYLVKQNLSALSDLSGWILAELSEEDFSFLLAASDLQMSLCQELGKTWEEVQSEDDRELVDDEDE